MRTKHHKGGFSLIELMVVLCIILVLTSLAIPYYHNAIETTYMTEATLAWGNLKRFAVGQNLSRHERIEEDLKNRLKHYTAKIICREPEPEEETAEEDQKPTSHEPCWEIEFYLQKPNQSIRYYLATQHNLSQLLCVPLNSDGTSFCQGLSARDQKESIPFAEKEAYLLYH